MMDKMQEDKKIEQLVFDNRSLYTLNRLVKKGIIDYLENPISTGKEAVVFRARSGENFLAVKIYKIETSKFVNKQEYLEGDPRFSLVKRTPTEIVYAFTRKEFKNLQIAEKAGVHSPSPFFQERNVIVMSFLGEQGVPYPQLYRASGIEEEHFYSIIEDVKKLYKAGLVHADLSEYNILLGDVPYLLDFAQGVVLKHPLAMEFLKRDVRNVVSFFNRRLQLNLDFNEVFEEVVS